MGICLNICALKIMRNNEAISTKYNSVSMNQSIGVLFLPLRTFRSFIRA